MSISLEVPGFCLRCSCDELRRAFADQHRLERNGVVIVMIWIFANRVTFEFLEDFIVESFNFTHVGEIGFLDGVDYLPNKLSSQFERECSQMFKKYRFLGILILVAPLK